MILTIPFKDLLPAIVFFSVLTFYVIYDRKNVYFKFFAKPKVKIYYIIFQAIQTSKNQTEYNPNIVLFKYFSEAQYIPNNANETIWKDAKNYWYNVYLAFPQELIVKLENVINVKDISYFDNLMYSKHPYFIETEFDQKKIYKIIKDQAIVWANTPKKKGQAVRLGYFVIKAGFLVPKDNNQESWLDVWNNELKDFIKTPMTELDLIKNPWSTGGDRTEISIKNNIDDIELFFYRNKWKKGVKLIEDGIDQ